MRGEINYIYFFLFLFFFCTKKRIETNINILYFYKKTRLWKIGIFQMKLFEIFERHRNSESTIFDSIARRDIYSISINTIAFSDSAQKMSFITANLYATEGSRAHRNPFFSSMLWAQTAFDLVRAKWQALCYEYTGIRMYPTGLRYATS